MKDKSREKTLTQHTLGTGHLSTCYFLLQEKL